MFVTKLPFYKLFDCLAVCITHFFGSVFNNVQILLWSQIKALLS